MKQIKKIKVELNRLNAEESTLQQRLKCTVDFAESKILREELSKVRQTRGNLLKNLELLTNEKDRLRRVPRKYASNSIVCISGRRRRV